MVIHKRTRLTPIQRQEIYDAHFKKKGRVCDLAQDYHFSRPRVYKILERARQRFFDS